MRDEIEAVLPEIVDVRGQFTMRDLMSRLNPQNEDRRRWAVEKAVLRLSRCSKQSGQRITPLGLGTYLEGNRVPGLPRRVVEET